MIDFTIQGSIRFAVICMNLYERGRCVNKPDTIKSFKNSCWSAIHIKIISLTSATFIIMYFIWQARSMMQYEWICADDWISSILLTWWTFIQTFGGISWTHSYACVSTSVAFHNRTHRHKSRTCTFSRWLLLKRVWVIKILTLLSHSVHYYKKLRVCVCVSPRVCA